MAVQNRILFWFWTPLRNIMFSVYLLQSQKNKSQVYLGYTSLKVEKRLVVHNNGFVRSTRPYKPWKIIFCEIFINKDDAKRREKYLKTTQGKKGLKLILRNTLK